MQTTTDVDTERAARAASTHRKRRGRAFLSVPLTLLCSVSGLALAAHYPLLPAAAIAIFIATALLSFRFPCAWPTFLPALLPVIGFAPWTGWITFEELDLLVLAVAAGGYAWLARPAPHGPAQRGGVSALVGFVLLLLIGSLAIAAVRGVSDAGGFVFGWYQAYREPMNSVRPLKSALAALLLLPLWLAAAASAPQQASRRLVLGLILGLTGASLAALWERVAFTGLVNFSTDYRTTALFWEMHVGGAAFDGFLALTVPFAAREVLAARSRKQWAFAAGVMVLAAYACLTTFSRGVYAAIPLGVILAIAIHQSQRRADPSTPAPPQPASALKAGIIVTAFTLGAAQMFPTSGYRGMLAVFLAASLLMPLTTVLRRFGRSGWITGLGFGAGLAAAGVALAWLLPKGPYIVCAFSALLTTSLLAFCWCLPSHRYARRAASLALGAWLMMPAGVVQVAAGWGGPKALDGALPVALALLLSLPALAGPARAALPPSLRWQGTVAAGLAVAASIVAAMNGGAYMTSRFSTAAGDLEVREAHWRQGATMLSTPADWLLGKGLGRYFDNFWVNAAQDQRPGDYRLHSEDQNSYLALVAGKHVLGWGELLRLSQRVAPPTGPATVQFDVRVQKPSTVHFEVCLKHLLYDGGCLVKDVKVSPKPGAWQRLQARLDGEPLSRGSWYAPKLVVFSIASEDPNHVTEIDNITLSGSDGRDLLTNGDFSAGTARWFFTSDRHHMPWHIKNVAAHVLFEQGLFGLLLLLVVWGGALWRVTLGHARRHPLAPGLAGALLGFAIIGLFDSLLDAPRVAFLFYLLVAIGLTLRQPARTATPRHPAADAAPIARVAAAMLVPAIVCACLLGPSPAVAADAAAAPAPAFIEVGPGRAIKTLAAAARFATDGAIVQVDAGNYVGDVAVWTQNRLTLRAVGGRVRLIANGASAEGKATWVVRADDVSVEGFDFEGSAVADRNGAGIRLESGSLRVRDCSFMHNEMGILTSNDRNVTLQVENSEFGHNMRPDGHNHNLYAGTIKHLTVTGSYFHHAVHGHLLKSRAAVNHIMYNRLTDGADGHASYELEFPNGGVALVVGNIIQQGPLTENPHLVSYAAEGYVWPSNQLVLAHNTLIDDRAEPGVFLRVRAGAAASVRVIDNLLVGAARWDLIGGAELHDNFNVTRADFDPAAADEFRLLRSSRGWGKAADAPARSAGDGSVPTRQYRHPRQTIPLTGPPRQPGAVQPTTP